MADCVKETQWYNIDKLNKYAPDALINFIRSTQCYLLATHVLYSGLLAWFVF